MASTVVPAKSAAGLRSVSNALRTIQALSEAEGSLSVTELAGHLELGVSTAHRLLRTLVAAGFARQDPDRRYAVGPALARIGGRPPTPPLLRDVGRPMIRWLAQATGETAHLAVLDGTWVVAVDHAAGARAGDVDHAVGARMPAHATAVGLALLAHHPAIADAVVDAGLDRWTTLTAADEVSFRRELDGVVRRGYAVNLRGWRDRTAGVAAPVLIGGGEAVAAIGISGPAERVGRRAAISELGQLVRAAALDLGERLAGTRPLHRR